MSPEITSRESPSSSIVVVPESERFKNAQHFLIGDNSNFSTVHGDQYNYYNTGIEVKRRYIVGTEEEEAEYAEFPEVKRGEFVAIRSICRSEGWHYDSEQGKYVKRGKRIAVAGDIRIGGVISRCTVVQYSGEGAGELWKEDFRGLCGVRRPENAQLVAINLSSIPMLVLTGDLVPVAHLKDQVGALGRMYLLSLAMQMGCCVDDSLWMDAPRGVFCHRPEGPECYIKGYFDFEDLSLDAELLKEDVMARYLGSRKQDRRVVDGLFSDWQADASQMKVNRPTVISTLTDTILTAGACGVWKEGEGSCLGKREELANGATRFSLLCDGRRLNLWSDWRETICDWLAQAPSIFHAYGIPLESDLHEYKLISPEKLLGTLSNSKAKQQRREECPTIYLFIPPLSTCIFWSFDPNGQNPITADVCDFLGLPISLDLECYGYFWTIETYKLLQTYQLARGFDPDTNEFARHNQYRIYEITKQPLPTRLEEIEDSVEAIATLLRTVRPVEEHDDMFLWVLFGDVKPKDSAANTVNQEVNIWSRFIPTFSWAALDNSDIPAAGF